MPWHSNTNSDDAAAQAADVMRAVGQTERAGFEPAVQFDPYAALAKRNYPQNGTVFTLRNRLSGHYLWRMCLGQKPSVRLGCSNRCSSLGDDLRVLTTSPRTYLLSSLVIALRQIGRLSEKPTSGRSRKRGHDGNEANRLKIHPGSLTFWRVSLIHEQSTTSAYGFRVRIGTSQNVRAAMPFSPRSSLSWLHDALSR